MKGKNIRFTAKEAGKDDTFIVLEPMDGNLEFELTIDLKETVDIEKTQEIAGYLEKNVAGLYLEE